MIRGFLELLLSSNLFPFILLSAGAVFILLCSLAVPAKHSRALLSLTSFVVVLGALVSLFVIPFGKEAYPNLLIHDWLGVGFGSVLLLLLLPVLLVIPAGTDSVQEAPSGVFSLLILSSCGGLLMVFANHFLVFFIGLELLSLPLYVLVGVGKNVRKSTEASFKYFLLGAISSALFIYGVALIWGALGTMNFSEMLSAYASTGSSYPGLVLMGSVLIVAGLAFKLGMVPFHMWVPDVYEGAPCHIVGWMSGAVKAATLAISIRFSTNLLALTEFDWVGALTLFATFSMLIGSLGALSQKSVKRILAYSAIAHAGYASIGIITSVNGAPEESAVALIYYILTYGIASLGAFMILSVEEGTRSLTIDDLAGMAKRKPGMAIVLAVSVLSLAGLPPLGGFVGKFNLLMVAVSQNLLGLALVAVATSVISLVYYLSLLVSVYMKEAEGSSPLRVRFGAMATLTMTAIATLMLGVFPNHVLSFFQDASHVLIR